MSLGNKYDVGLVIPLKEEFRYLSEIAPVSSRHSYDGTFFYELNFDCASVIACIVGDMGPLPAMQATNRLLTFARIKVVVLLGLGGSLDSEVRLADVVVADEVNEFLAKSKAVETREGYEFRFSGRHTRLEFSLREVINHFDVSGGKCLTNWHEMAKPDHDELDATVDRTLCNSPPVLHVGSIASGDVVSSANSFTNELLGIDRKFLALDMEAAGVVKAATDRVTPVRVLIIRGISDFADKRKSELDHQGKGIWRRLAVRNATGFLVSILAWADFRSCIGIDQSIDGTNEAFEPAIVIDRLRDHIGGPWITGISFGVYFQAPVTNEDGGAETRPIASLRLADKHLDDMIHTVEMVQTAMQEHSVSLDDFCLKLGTAIDQYRASLDEARLAVIKQFDQVIVAMFGTADPAKSSELQAALSQTELMIDDGRLDEAEQILRGLDAKHPIVRALWADLFFNRHQYADLVQLLSTGDPETLSRRELEHLVVSCYESHKVQAAVDFLQTHTRRFPDSAGKLFQHNIRSRYPVDAAGSGGTT